MTDSDAIKEELRSVKADIAEVRSELLLEMERRFAEARDSNRRMEVRLIGVMLLAVVLSGFVGRLIWGG